MVQLLRARLFFLEWYDGEGGGSNSGDTAGGSSSRFV